MMTCPLLSAITLFDAGATQEIVLVPAEKAIFAPVVEISGVAARVIVPSPTTVQSVTSTSLAVWCWMQPQKVSAATAPWLAKSMRPVGTAPSVSAPVPVEVVSCWARSNVLCAMSAPPIKNHFIGALRVDAHGQQR